MNKFVNICFVFSLFSLALSQNAYSKQTNKTKNKHHQNHKLNKIEKCVKDTEKQYALPKSLLSAVIAQESDFKETAINNSTTPRSFGLGQITLPTARNFCKIKTKKELLQHDKNIKCTAKILKHHISTYGSVHSALAAYRTGTPCNKKYKRKQNQNQNHRMCTRSDEKYISSIVKKKEIFSN